MATGFVGGRFGKKSVSERKKPVAKQNAAAQRRAARMRSDSGRAFMRARVYKQACAPSEVEGPTTAPGGVFSAARSVVLRLRSARKARPLTRLRHPLPASGARAKVAGSARDRRCGHGLDYRIVQRRDRGVLRLHLRSEPIPLDRLGGRRSDGEKLRLPGDALPLVRRELAEEMLDGRRAGERDGVDGVEHGAQFVEIVIGGLCAVRDAEVDVRAALPQLVDQFVAPFL